MRASFFQWLTLALLTVAFSAGTTLAAEDTDPAKEDSDKPAAKKEDSGSDEKPGEPKTDTPDKQPTAEKPKDEKPTDKPAEKKPVDPQPDDAPDNNGKSDDTKGEGEKSGDEKPSPPAPDDAPSTGEKPPEKKPADEKPGEEKPEEKDADAPPADRPKGEAFSKLFDEWKLLLSKLRTLRDDFREADAAEKKKIRKEYNDLLAKGEKMADQLRQAAVAAYQEYPDAEKSPLTKKLEGLLIAMAADDVRRDEFRSAGDLLQVLIEGGTKDPRAYDLAGIAAFSTNRFADAARYFDRAQEIGSLSKMGQKFAPFVDQYLGLWETEKKLREGQDDLPLVELNTTEGKIVVELFEEEAPGTVGNFISLVEKGFYDGVVFHRVLPAFMAQTGDPQGTGQGGPGYRIRDELGEGHRKHFAGSLSMANTGQPNTGGSQFFITFVPTPHLNSKHTVFGRVVEGWDVLPKLQRIDPDKPSGAKPDKILSAKVLRKTEGKEYKPDKVAEE